MAELLFANNAVATLAGAISSTATTAQLASGTGTLFPNPGSNQYFKLTFNDAATGLLREIVNVTAISGDTITAMTRGQEGTTPLSWLAGDIAANLWTAGSAAALAQVESQVWQQSVHGNYTFVVPAGVFLLKNVRIVGAGGGGGGGNGGVTWSSGGGGSGGYSEGWIEVTPLQSIGVIVGQGGSGASNGNGAVAGSGGTTTVGAFMSATGGGGGVGGTSTSAGGGPGLGTGGTITNDYGANGGDGNLGNANVQGGPGASSAFGGGGRTGTLTGIGTNGLAPGSGGGGIWGSGGSAATGGNGADGQVIIEY